ncbi:hypothetical protein MYG64_11045 [Ensifer adhaerens]|uniref:hypothetical protein n=1 Tax=Ensifer adhaerens TaxID=106592 RepID=UPI0021007C84|nr:hypothetical protein [Ensifer adhaerens]UTV35099.1 hypothetical protein MYG64_11045 [Ensifer adhaerens]
MKGEPTSKSLDGVWIYDVKDSSNNQTLGTYHVRFRDGKVRYVLYVPGGYHSDKEYPFGFSDGTKLALIEGRLGKSPNISEKPDGNARLYSYPEYNAFFGLGKGMVEIYGMYDPATGPLKFATNSSL